MNKQKHSSDMGHIIPDKMLYIECILKFTTVLLRVFKYIPQCLLEDFYSQQSLVYSNFAI